MYVRDTQSPSETQVQMCITFHLILKEMGQTECMGFRSTSTFTRQKFKENT